MLKIQRAIDLHLRVKPALSLLKANQNRSPGPVKGFAQENRTVRRHTGPANNPGEANEPADRFVQFIHASPVAARREHGRATLPGGAFVQRGKALPEVPAMFIRRQVAITADLNEHRKSGKVLAPFPINPS